MKSFYIFSPELFWSLAGLSVAKTSVMSLNFDLEDECVLQPEETKKTQS